MSDPKLDAVQRMVSDMLGLSPSDVVRRATGREHIAAEQAHAEGGETDFIYVRIAPEGQPAEIFVVEHAGGEC